MRVFDLGGDGAPQQESDRVLTVPNLLSFARIAVLPVIYLDLVGGRHLRALVLLAVFAATDWLDGFLARQLRQVSRLGRLLDPFSDRVLFVVVGVGFVVAGIVPLWAIAALLVRDLAVLGVGGVLLLVRGTRLPEVTRLGKAATFGLMFALPLFLGAAILGEGPADPQPVLNAVAWATFLVNLALYYAAALGYARTVLHAGR